MKKIVPVIIGIIVAALIAGGVIFFVKKKGNASSSKRVIYVDSVSNITGYGYTSVQKYLGTVETQEIKGIDKDSDKVVKELMVKEGDTVKRGDVLFTYDTDEMTLKLRQMELELSSVYISIETMNGQIAQLEAERAQAGPDEKLQYTAQIQNIQAQINQSNYEAEEKQLQIDKQKKAIENAEVCSPMNGTITKIQNQGSDDDDDSDYDYSDGDNHFISIMAVGDYRIKGVGNEVSIRTITEGDRVIIKSRLDESLVWYGKISEIDTEHTEQNNDNYYGGGNETASKYPFYVDVDNLEGLLMGQHVYIEMDYGQTEQKEGIWLSEFYVVKEEETSYVWVANDKDKIEKRIVELGEYDENLMAYNIVSGLELTDYIAYPDGKIQEGMKITHDVSEATYDDMGDSENDEDMNMEDYEFEDFNEDINEEYDGESFDEEFDKDELDGDEINDEEFDGGDEVPDEEFDEEEPVGCAPVLPSSEEVA